VEQEEAGRGPGRRGVARRPRGAKATRAAILGAARARFTREGYDRVRLGDVAEDATVNAALVVRYFGSKEGLFAEAVASSGGEELEQVLSEELSGLGWGLARYVVASKEDFDPLLAMLRSASDETAARMLREALDEGFVRPLAARMDGADAELRAGMVAAELLGVMVAREVVRSGALSEAGPERLVAHLAPILQAHIDGQQPSTR
jgi:AcrR family transcriptional regulator